MSFSEKLVQLRKNNKMSQEALAELLDVTRQSVSKWESGQTYPEMDKLLSMCKIFKCSLDDLTNDEITTVKIEDKKKGNLNTFIDSALEFMEKTYHMFRGFRFPEIVKCLFIMGVLALCLFLLRLPFDYLEETVSSLIHNFGHGALVSTVVGLFNLIADIGFFILYMLIFIYLFKMIYLDQYEAIQTPVPVKEESEKKVIVHAVEPMERRKDNSYVFFDFLGKGVMLFIKMMVCLFTIPFILSLFGISASLIITIILLFKGVFYIGVLLGLIFSLILNLLILEFVFNFLTNRKNKKRMLLVLMVGIVGLGLSFGIFMFEGAMTEYIDDVPAREKPSFIEKKVTMTTDFTIFWMHDYNTTYQVDESLGNEVKIQVKYYDDYSKVSFPEEDTAYYFRKDVSGNESKIKLFKYFIKDLSKKKLYNYSKLFDTEVTIVATEENISKMKENFRKYEQEQEEQRRQNERDEYQDVIRSYEEEIQRLENENENLKMELDEKKLTMEEYQEKLKEYKENIQSIIGD